MVSVSFMYGVGTPILGMRNQKKTRKTSSEHKIEIAT